MPKLVQLCIVVMSFCLNAYSLQQSSTFDVFPLRKGLCYDYTYYYELQGYELMYLDFVKTDSGFVRYTVIDSAASGDTATIWSVSQHANLLYHQYGANLHDTTYRTDDSTLITLMESRIASHPLSCPGIVWSFSFMDAEPRVMRFSDSESVWITRPYLPNPPMVGTDAMWFFSDRGYLKR